MRDDPTLRVSILSLPFTVVRSALPAEGYERPDPVVVAQCATVILHPSAFILQAATAAAAGTASRPSPLPRRTKRRAARRRIGARRIPRPGRGAAGPGRRGRR